MHNQVLAVSFYKFVIFLEGGGDSSKLMIWCVKYCSEMHTLPTFNF